MVTCSDQVLPVDKVAKETPLFGEVKILLFAPITADPLERKSFQNR